MKKMYVTAAMAAAMALMVTACSSGSTSQTETTASQAATEAAAQKTTATETQETQEEEEDFFYGVITEVQGQNLTIDDNGEIATFDCSEAEYSDDYELVPGDEVEVTFYGTLSEDVTKAVYVEIIASAAQEAEEEALANADPVMTGTIEKVEGTTLDLKSDEDEAVYTFDTSIAQQVSLGGIQAGVEAEITYYGDLEDEEYLPMATRIVTEDAYDSEDAQEYTLTGTVVETGEDYIVLQTADQDQSVFTFVGEAGMFDGPAQGDTATVIYEGTLTGKTVTGLGLK